MAIRNLKGQFVKGDRTLGRKKGYKHTEEEKQKIRDWNKTHDNPGRFKKGQPKPKNAYKFEKGHEVLQITRDKIGLGNKGKKLTEKRKQEIREWCIKNHIAPPEETRHHFEKGYTPYNKGIKLPSEVGIKMGLSRTGEKHWNWLGGKSFEPYSVEWTKALKKVIREKYKYTCQICLKYGDCVHHIDYNKKKCNPDNLITLCRRCHIRTNFHRHYWEQYFINHYENNTLHNIGFARRVITHQT